MKDIIEINYSSEQPTVLGRDLHKALKIKTEYTKWLDRMCEYGFTEGEDYSSILTNRSDGKAGKPRTDHQLTIPMAKEICMIQRSDIGKQYRQYFLKIEEQWNSPEAVMARALKLANKQLDELKVANLQLSETIESNKKTISEMKPKAKYYDIVLNSKDLLPITVIAKDYGKSAREFNKLLYDMKIQYKLEKIWVLYQKYASKGYTSTKTHVYDSLDGRKHTIVYTYWTQKGRLFIYDVLKERGILPLIERL